MGLVGFFKKKKVKGIDKSRLPVHIAIIPDGNGRWAKKRGMPRSLGHREGGRTLRKIVEYSSQIGIKYLTVYAFSTENWVRPREEVDSLMDLLLEYLRNAENELKGSKVRIKVIGQINGLSSELQKEITRVEAMTASETGLTLLFALNYGGRDEIVNMVKRIAEDVRNSKLKISGIDQTTVSNYLYTAGIPDPDLIIRTSGEKRASNYLLWQSAYSEYIFPEVLWPDFGKEHLLDAIREFQSRNRRFGGV